MRQRENEKNQQPKSNDAREGGKRAERQMRAKR